MSYSAILEIKTEQSIYCNYLKVLSYAISAAESHLMLYPGAFFAFGSSNLKKAGARIKQTNRPGFFFKMKRRTEARLLEHLNIMHQLLVESEFF